MTRTAPDKDALKRLFRDVEDRLTAGEGLESPAARKLLRKPGAAARKPAAAPQARKD